MYINIILDNIWPILKGHSKPYHMLILILDLYDPHSRPSWPIGESIWSLGALKRVVMIIHIGKWDRIVECCRSWNVSIWIVSPKYVFFIKVISTLFKKFFFRKSTILWSLVNLKRHWISHIRSIIFWSKCKI